MASLKEIRTRINSVKLTRKVTSAMKMVSAAKLRKAQEAIADIRPYADKLQEILSHLAASMDTYTENLYAHEREVKNVLLIPITSNKGLCGALNANVIKKTMQLINNEYKDYKKNKNLKIITIGKNAEDVLKSRGIEIESQHNDIFDMLSFSNVRKIAEEIMEDYLYEKYDKVEIIYNQFRNAANQDLIISQFLPICVDEDIPAQQYHSDYIFEPDKEFIITEIIPKSLKIEFYKILLDSNASEHGARMTAMHNATENASELIRELNLNYNKARQSEITKEIIEIVSGAEALRRG